MLRSLILIVLVVTYANGYNVVCYYTNWAQYRPYGAKFFPENIDANLCTHIIYEFAKIEGLTVTNREWNDYIMYPKIVNLKATNPSLKIFLAVGGFNLGSAPFIYLSSSPSNRNTFARNVARYIRSINFDGFEVDWKFPDAAQKDNYAKLIKELYDVFKEEGNTTRRARLELSLSLAAGRDHIDKGLNIPEISKYADMMNIMTLDFHGTWERFTGFNSPLFPELSEVGAAAQLNVDWVMFHYMALGATASKLNLGIAAYGKSFSTVNSNEDTVFAKTTGPGRAFRMSQLAGFATYYEICEFIKEGGTKVSKIQSQKSTIVVKDTLWIGFDNVQDVTERACYARRKHLGGVFFFTMDYDDFIGALCLLGKFPLLTAVYNAAKYGVGCSDKEEATSQIVADNEGDQLEDALTVFCYYTNWSQYRPGDGKFFPENVDPNLCTHISFAFNKPVGTTVDKFEWNDYEMFSRVINLKHRNPQLLVLLAVGGWNMGTAPFIEPVRNADNRESFAINVVTYLRTHKFDGFEMDWEYPDATYKDSFADLLKKLKEAFESEAKQTGNAPLLLGVAVAAGKKNIDAGYDVPKVSRYADFINIMTYDLHGSWENFTGFNSPLYAHPSEVGDAAFLNVDWAVQYWISLGAHMDKINIGIASYGRTFRLNNAANHGLFAPSFGPGDNTTYVREPGATSYYEICQLIKEGNEPIRVESQGSVYIFKGTHWVGYDDEQSVIKKACYAKQNSYGGVIFWTLAMDDFTGNFCNRGKYPLLNAINNALQRDVGCEDGPEIPNIIETLQPKGGFKVFCYYANWAQYRPGDGIFFPEDVDPSLCTHLSYAFNKPVGVQITPFETNDIQMFTRIMQLKNQNPNLLILLAVGGWNMGSEVFTELVKNAPNREAFARNVVSYLRTHRFDGFEMDWEYPNATYKADFANLIQTLRETFEIEAQQTRNTRLLLGVAVAAGKSNIDAGYDVPKISQYADLINIMTYDLHGSWENITGFNAPLYASPQETGDARYLNVDWAVKYWESLGAPKEKTNFGIASYGRTFRLKNEAENDLFAPAIGPGDNTTYVREPGATSYYEICELSKSNPYVVHDVSQDSVYMVKGTHWVGYDDIESVIKKACYARNNGYAGVIFWSLDHDDFSGKFCGLGKYPLLHAVNRALYQGTGCHVGTMQLPLEEKSCCGLFYSNGMFMQVFFAYFIMNKLLI